MTVLQKPRPRLRGGERTTYRLYVSSLFENRLGGVLGPLVSLFGLDVYGDSLLGRRARIEIKAAALMLLMNFLFDWGAWSLLLNAALHSQVRAIDPWTAVALVGGLVIGTSVLIYERQFFVADPRQSRWSAALLIRGTVIVLSALITAQPVELLFFRGPIDRRVHEEGVRQEAVALRQKLDKALKDREERSKELASLPDRLGDELEGRELDSKQGALSDAVQERNRQNALLAQARSAENAWTSRLGQRRAELSTAKRGPGSSPEEVDRLQSLVEEARRQLGECRARRQALTVDLAAAESGLAHADKEVQQAKGELKQRRDQLVQKAEMAVHQSEADRDRLESWVTQLAKASPGAAEPIVEERVQRFAAAMPQLMASFLGQEPFTYRYPVYDFFEQLRVLADLRSGRPPLWRGASVSMVTALKQEYGLEDVRPCGAGSAGSRRATAGAKGAEEEPCDPVAWERHQAQTHLFWISWLVIYGVALILPLLVIAMKFLVARELRDYYVEELQQRAGHVS
jgi:hypothetical protein